MAFLLNSQNVFEYLANHGLCIQEERNLSQVELKVAKNFNLLLELPAERRLLVKQERHNREGKAVGEFLNEWRNHEFFQRFSELHPILPSLSEVLHFDTDNSILVFNYLNNYRELAELYTKENVFSVAIATAIGKLIATIHRATLDRQEYQDFLAQNREDAGFTSASFKTRSWEQIGPEVFSMYPADSIKFFALYQRYDSLGRAIAELADAFQPCCLTHNDLKLNNILLHNDWEQIISKAEKSPLAPLNKEGERGDRIVRLIDWERGSWGDPAFDLGTITASYLQHWLNSLIISNDIALEEALRLAMTPLELLQPSIAALAGAYFGSFPEILERRPDFLQRVVQFAGLALTHQIQAMIQYQKSFSNTGICMLQVAKSLLCRPEQSILTVFGTSGAELTHLNYSPV